MAPPRVVSVASVLASATLLAALASCRARHRPAPDEDSADVPALTHTDVTTDSTTDPSPHLPRPLITLHDLQGDVRWEPTHRCTGLRQSAGGAITTGQPLHCGDRAYTAPGARATLRFVPGTSLSLDASSTVEIPAHTGADAVLVHGLARAIAPFETAQPLRIDTPATRVIVSSGTALLAVAADGAVQIIALEGVVTVWSAHNTIGRTLAVGSTRTWASNGDAIPNAPTHLTPPRAERALRRWLAQRDTATASARDVIVRVQTRAANADEGIVRDLQARIPGAHGRELDTMEGTLSLALGRLHARVRSLQAYDPAAFARFDALRDELRTR